MIVSLICTSVIMFARVQECIKKGKDSLLLITCLIILNFAFFLIHVAKFYISSHKKQFMSKHIQVLFFLKQIVLIWTLGRLVTKSIPKLASIIFVLNAEMPILFTAGAASKFSNHGEIVLFFQPISLSTVCEFWGHVLWSVTALYS